MHDTQKPYAKPFPLFNAGVLFLFFVCSPSQAFATTTSHDLSPLGMFAAADWVVKSVMLLLVLASLATWSILFAKLWELRHTKRILSSSVVAVQQAPALAQAIKNTQVEGVGRALLDCANTELSHCKKLLSHSHNRPPIHQGLKERIGSACNQVEAAMTRDMKIGTGMLATVGAVAPFIGLFGTVWGIMNSFIGIAQANTTNLAVVAPGIAEALLATAMGLVAAIPAVIFYNQINRQISAIRASIIDCSALIQRLVSRELDHHYLTQTES